MPKKELTPFEKFQQLAKRVVSAQKPLPTPSGDRDAGGKKPLAS